MVTLGRGTGPPGTPAVDILLIGAGPGAGEATGDHRCVKTEDQTAVAAGHDMDPAHAAGDVRGSDGPIAGRCARVEPRWRAREFVLWLSSDLLRKNCWTLDAGRQRWGCRLQTGIPEEVGFAAKLALAARVINNSPASQVVPGGAGVAGAVGCRRKTEVDGGRWADLMPSCRHRSVRESHESVGCLLAPRPYLPGSGIMTEVSNGGGRGEGRIAWCSGGV